MSVVDVHSHVTPPSFREAVLDGGTWHTLTNAIGELEIPEFSIAPKDRIAKMDAAGIDMHVLTVNNDFYRYELDPGPTQEIARACNEEIGQMMADHPDRFTGLATVPMQDIERAVAEMEYAMSKLGYRGITINDHVNGVTFDEPRFYPFWELWNPLARWCSSASAGRRWSRRAPPAMRCRTASATSSTVPSRSARSYSAASWTATPNSRSAGARGRLRAVRCRADG